MKISAFETLQQVSFRYRTCVKFTLCDVYQEQQCVMDDELSGESEQILIHSLKQSRDQNHSQILSRHPVHLREHLDPEEETDLDSDLKMSG